MTTTAAKRMKQSRASRTFRLVPEATRTEAAGHRQLPSCIWDYSTHTHVCGADGQTDRQVPVWCSSTMSSVLLWVTLLS